MSAGRAAEGALRRSRPSLARLVGAATAARAGREDVLANSAPGRQHPTRLRGHRDRRQRFTRQALAEGTVADPRRCPGCLRLLDRHMAALSPGGTAVLEDFRREKVHRVGRRPFTRGFDAYLESEAEAMAALWQRLAPGAPPGHGFGPAL